MKNEEFDALLKDALLEESQPVDIPDKEANWKLIQTKLQTKKSNKPKLFYGFSIVTAAAIVFFFLMNSFHQGTNLASNNQHTSLNSANGSASSSSNNNTVRLTLTDHTPKELKDPSPSDKSKTYEVSLPIYPNGKATSAKYMVSKDSPMVAPLYSASKKYIVPADEDTVMNWYKNAFKSKGYTIDLSDGTVSDGSKTIYHYFSEKNKQGINVDLGFKKISDSQTYVSYYAWYVPTVQRSKSSLLLDKVNKITITRKKGNKILATKTLIDPSQIQTIVQIMNQLQPQNPGETVSPADNGISYDFEFYTNGHVWSAYYNPTFRGISFGKQTLQTNAEFDDQLKKIFHIKFVFE